MAIVKPNPQMEFLVKDSGVLIANFKAKYDAIVDLDGLIDAILEEMDTENYLGITRGGVTFGMEAEARIVEYDGRRVRSVGDFSIDSATPTISTNLLVHSIPNLQRVQPMSDTTEATTANTAKTTMRSRLGSPRPTDYEESISWIREDVGGGIKIQTVFNAINVSTAAETGADKSESELPVEFIGTAKTFSDTSHAPHETVIYRLTD